jgi:hypothetical protein
MTDDSSPKSSRNRNRSYNSRQTSMIAPENKRARRGAGQRAQESTAPQNCANPTKPQVATFTFSQRCELQHCINARVVLRRRITLLRLIQRPVGALFWLFEQHIAKLSDRLELMGGRA